MMREFFYGLHKFIYAKAGVLDNVVFSLPIVITITAIFWLVRHALHKRKFKKEFKEIRKNSRWNEIIGLLIFFWFTEIICVALTPSAFWDVFWSNIIADDSFNISVWQFSYNAPDLSPTIIDYIIQGHLDWMLHSAMYIMPHFAANIVMFVPLGSALPFVCKGTFLRTVIIALSCSFVIEFLQCFIGRDSDIDDLICNTLGAVIGYLLYLLIKKLFPNFTKKGKLSANDLWRKTHSADSEA